MSKQPPVGSGLPHYQGFTLTYKHTHTHSVGLLLISNFRRVLNVVFFLMGNTPASEFYMPTFRNTLSVPSL
jgi:hypothetical protein